METNLPKNFPGAAASGSPTASALPKNFPTGAAAPATAPAAGPPLPEVTRGEIAEFFARNLVTMRDQARSGSTRPRLYAVEFPYQDFVRDVAAAFAKLIGATFQASDGPMPATPAQPLVVLGTNDDVFVHYLNHGQDVTVFCPRAWMLPQPTQDLVDTRLTMPRFDAASFAAACADFYELPAPPALDADTRWVGSVVPRDFLLSSQATAAEIVPAVRQAMERRLARYAPDAALEISDFSGMEEARSWAGSLVEEIRLAQSGRLPWAEVESGVALAGARGVGKSSLARAIARAAGLRYVETSAFNWMSTEKQPELGYQRLAADFQEALNAVPAVFFIGDIDVFGAMPWGMLIGPFVQYLQSLKGEPGLVVVAGVQTSKAVPLPLRQRGALESVIAVSLPNSQALGKMYERMLKDKPHSLSAADFDAIGRVSLGIAGDGVELVVRRALRRARKDGSRPVSKDDLASTLVQEVHGARAESRGQLMGKDELRNTAYHEAGHAILQLMHRRSPGLRYLTIVPREDGTLGFMWPATDETRSGATRQDMIDEIRVALAGRAAEEVLGGKDNVTGGCISDLLHAAWQLRMMLTRTGHNGLLSMDIKLEDSPELRAKAEEILDAEYAQVVAVLQRHRSLLDQVAQLLIERQEVSGDELMALYASYRKKNPDS